MGFLSCSIEVLLGFISFHWDFPGLTGWWVGFTGFYWVLLGLTITRVSMAKAGHARGANGARIRSRCLEIVGQVERKCDGDWIRWRERSFVPSESLEPAGFYRVLRSFCARACVSVCVWVCVCVCVCVCVASPVGLFVQKRCLETADQVQFQVPSGTSWMIRSSLAAISVVFPSIRFHSIP